MRRASNSHNTEEFFSVLLYNDNASMLWFKILKSIEKHCCVTDDADLYKYSCHLCSNLNLLYENKLFLC